MLFLVDVVYCSTVNYIIDHRRAGSEQWLAICSHLYGELVWERKVSTIYYTTNSVALLHLMFDRLIS